MDNNNWRADPTKTYYFGMAMASAVWFLALLLVMAFFVR
jgi:hypothetical protein